MSELFCCSTCNVFLKTKICLQAHAKSKRHIDRTRSPNPGNGRFVCGGCKKHYASRQSLYVHIKTCTVVAVPLTLDRITAETIEDLKNTVREDRKKHQLERDEYLKKQEEHEKQHEEMKAQIAMLLEKHATVNTTNNNTNNTNSHNQSINININAFGNEKTDYIDEKAFLSCIDKVYKSIPSLLEKIHFDPKHPENHNIKITNKKQPYASIMGNNQKWKTVDRKDAIESMVQKGYNLLDDSYVEHKNKFSQMKQQNFEGFQTKFEADDKDLVRQLKTEVDMLVLNGII
jgi:hypothetical protein